MGCNPCDRARSSRAPESPVNSDFRPPAGVHRVAGRSSYEVFILSRMREEYNRTGSTET
jgi:hypothetical protein